eukprot:TRINITY_DN6749_c0_g1_i2.p1 TRINITY_DN6749_c0_g1~~TRINITY_DN6749_c0_g1_i2.p1  ORF type:complete len:297 (+),score=12.76 TRINITY_DN6749_c0_g1_i2:48-938(+)
MYELSEIELVAAGIGGFLYVVYIFAYLLIFYFFPGNSWLGQQSIQRKIWINKILIFGEYPPIMAIQSLRNSITASSFLASIAMTVAFNILQKATDKNFQEYKVKMMTLGAFFLSAVFFFAMTCNVESALGFNLCLVNDKSKNPKFGTNPDAEWNEMIHCKVTDLIESPFVTADTLETSEQKIIRQTSDVQALWSSTAGQLAMTSIRDESRLTFTRFFLPRYWQQKYRRNFNNTWGVKHRLGRAHRLGVIAIVCFNLGFHMFYMAVPIVFWLLGPFYFIGSAAIILFVMAFQDFTVK